MDIMDTSLWAEIEQLYIEGDSSYRELAQRFNFAPKTVERHGKAGHWVEKRAAYRRRKAADWERIRDIYIYGERLPGRYIWRTSSSLAERFSVDPDELKERARKGRWDAERERAKRAWRERHVRKW